ncbi:MAG: FprA family A-type flavoprotein, partial [Candidatus Bathyarchaeota archaeon]|nr:FprA family A-type flavoprotein [Candidatus Bathyarchaeota archaeon]
MAKAVAEGAKSAGAFDVDLKYHVDADELIAFDAILLGVPTYHHDFPIDMKKLFEEAAAKGLSLKGKIGGTFGSYGWSGEAPKLLLEIMKSKFEMQVIEPPLLAKYVPDESMLEKCQDFGRRVSETLIHRT